MSQRNGSVFIIGLSLSLSLSLLLANAVADPVRGKSADGLPYLTGGVSISGLQEIEGEKSNYSLWVTTAAKGSGAHLSDANLKVVDTNKKVVLDTTIIGPWLFADLPLGTYAVEVAYNGQTQKRTTAIHKGDHHQLIFYFESSAEISPDAEDKTKDTPYTKK